MKPLRRTFRFPWGTRQTIADDIEREIAFHLDAHTEELISAGVPAERARGIAESQFGDLDRARRHLHRIDEGQMIARNRAELGGEILADARYALRTLLRNPSYTLVALITLALGIGANSAIFSIVNGVLLRPLPFPHPEQLLSLRQSSAGSDGKTVPVSVLDLEDWRARRRSLADLGGYFYVEGMSGTDLVGIGEPQRLATAFVTPGFWGTLGVAPALGRLPRDDEMVRGAGDRLVVLSHDFWSRQFGASPSAVGRRVTLGKDSYEIVGVMPPTFRFPSAHVDAFIPYSTVPDNDIPHIRPVRILSVVARMKPGVRVAQVAAELDAVARGLSEQYPEDREWTGVAVIPLEESVVGGVRRGLAVLFGAVLFVLLIAVVNLASLMLARAVSRERELALRAALGAGRARIFRQLLTESVVLALAGGVCGLAVAGAGVHVFVSLAAGQLPRAEEISLDPAVLLFTLAVSVAAGVAFGLLPALRVSSPRLQERLRDGTRGSPATGTRMRGALVVAEVGLAMVLAIGAGLMTRSFLKLLDVNLGFNPDRLVAVTFTISEVNHPSRDDRSRYYRAVLDRARSLPGVVSVSGIRDLPFRGDGEVVPVLRRGDTPAASGVTSTATLMFTADGFFQTMGIPLIAGRDLAPDDRRNAPVALVVNRAFADKYFAGANPVGQRISFGDTTFRPIVGLVGDVRQNAVDQPAVPTVYVSVFQLERVKVNLVARTRGDPRVMIKRLEDAIHFVDPRQTITAAYTLDESVSDALARPRLLTVLLGAFGAMGLVVGALGIYGVLAYLVTQRTREIGVRVALGARRGDVVMMIVRRGVRLAAMGVAIGGAAALAFSRLMAGVLFQVSTTDPATFAAVAAVLLVVAGLASWVPARRASQVDAVVALRYE